jgi:hypothetical protein
MNKLSQECINEIEKEYRDYCKKTGRGGGVLISSSIKEIATHLVNHVLSTPTIYQSAGLMSIDEALRFMRFSREKAMGVTNEENFLYQGKFVTTTELLTIFRKTNP